MFILFNVSYYLSINLFQNVVFFKNVSSNLNTIKPIIPPRRFVIISSISDDLPIKYWKNSIPNVRANVINIVLYAFLLLLNTTGRKNPNGIKSIIFGIFSIKNCSIPISCKLNGIKFNICVSGSNVIGVNKIVANIIRKTEAPNPI